MIFLMKLTSEGQETTTEISNQVDLDMTSSYYVSYLCSRRAQPFEAK